MVPWLVSTVLSTISDMVANGYLLLHKKVGPSLSYKLASHPTAKFFSLDKKKDRTENNT
jgi:hypothetical protein